MIKDDRDLDEICFATVLSSLAIIFALLVLSISYFVAGFAGPLVVVTIVTAGYFVGRLISSYTT